LDTDDRAEAEALAEAAAAEARRVEAKFSRYRAGNLVHAINHAGGAPVEVDAETAQLLDYAATCHEVSEGLFDVTSGVLRRVWKFDGGSRVPTAAAVREVLRHVGWHRVSWQNPTLRMPAGMEIDLGGIGKEYAVDRASQLLAARTGNSCLVNFGGDLFASGLRRGGRPWGVGVDDPERTGEAVLYRIDLFRGGLATSGDARRFVRWRGRRLGHILNPKTGWPVEGAPRSVTVLAPTCLEAGTLATLACLRGPGAREFLEQQGTEFRIL
ncbi:MAG TPA: FAD:protein FMN transferase, partial [Candidatus Saccharimonadales bacterium]|nr:FAD:protein FMN transferase [Candidatus Saccharimonadales bacterium]